MKKSTYSRLSQSISTVKKSHAIIERAWAWRNSRQQGPARVSGGRHPGLAHDLPNRRRGDLHAETGQLTNDPLIAPAWVLTGNPQNELADVLRDRGPGRGRRPA
jgi:hypothetical protein